MVLLSACAMMALVALAAGQACPQERYNTRNQYELAEDKDGLDITLWNRAGVNLIGTLTGGVADEVADTTTVSGTATATSNDVFANLASFDDLEENGDQFFLVVADIDVSNVRDTESCFIEFGDIDSPGGFCATAAGDLLFPNRFAITVEQHALDSTPDGSNTVAFKIRRFSDGDIIRLDITSNVNGVSVERTNLPAAAWDIAAGLTISSPEDDDAMTAASESVIKQIIVLEGRSSQTAADSIFSSASTDADNLAQCTFQQYSTGDSPVIAGSGEGNLVLTLTTTNFGPDLVAERTGNVQFAPIENTGECDGETIVSNFTAIATTGVTFDATIFDGTSQSATFAALEVGASQTFTFTATVSSAAPTTVDPPLTTTAISIDGNDAEIYIQRRSNLVFVIEDTRPFNLQELPIAAGCEVPFTYTVDVFNEGPSCVEALQISTASELVQNCAATGDAGAATTPDIVVALIEPNTLAETDPFEFSISADGNAQNAERLTRTLLLQSPLDGGITAEDQATPIDSADDIVDEPEDRSLLDLEYDVRRYADLRLTWAWDNDATAVVAGSFDSSDSPNLCGTLTVENRGCVDVADLVVRTQIDVAPGVHIEGEASTDFDAAVTKTGRIEIASLANGATTTREFCFSACQCARFAPNAIRVRAAVLRQGEVLGDLQELENTDGVESGCGRTELVRRFDDSIDQAVDVTLGSVPEVVLRCDKPRVVTTSQFDAEVAKDDDDDSSSSSSSSSSSKDGDIDLLKVTRCTLTVANNGPSDTPLQVNVDYALPSGTRLVHWEASSESQFTDRRWVVPGLSQAGAVNSACPARSDVTSSLNLDFVSTRPGTWTLCARIDETKSSADINDNDPNTQVGQCASLKA